MAIARRQRQKSFFLTPLATQCKRSLFRQLLALFCFSIVLFGYFSLQLFFRSRNTVHRQEHRSESNGVNLFHSPDDIPIDLVYDFDAILVLGGGRPKSIDHPPVFVERRCDDAIQVFRRRFIEDRTDKKSGGVKGRDYARNNSKKYLPILCLSAGTAHLPQLLSADGLPIWESTACAAYILSKSQNGDSTEAESITIPPEMIYAETSSYDTIGNAYFARTSHTEFNGWRKLLVVTNEFHMERTMKIFDWIFSVPTDAYANQISGPRYDLYYLESPNVGMTSEVVAARKEREASSMKSVDHLSRKFETLRGVYEFLTHDHSLYTANLLVDRGHATAAEVEEESVKEAVKKSYGAS